jgi:UDP-N-acetylmuramate--alanine ligase
MIVPEPLLPEDLAGSKIHLVGIKGTGMTALAEILVARGAIVTGSDVPEIFYTDRILKQIGVSVHSGFAKEHIPDNCRLAIRSAAWNDDNPEIRELINRNIPLLQYTEALGELSKRARSCAIAGVHGKTSTTAMTGSILKETNLPFTVIVGSGVSNFSGCATWSSGTDYLVAETCEYRRHFLSFSPSAILLTSVEEDHLDYFKDLADIESAFIEFGQKLPRLGVFIFCSDDKGALETARKIRNLRSDLQFIPYGETVPDDWGGDTRFRIQHSSMGDGESRFKLEGFSREFILGIPGKHMILNAAGALAAAVTLSRWGNTDGASDYLDSLASGLLNFKGTRRRSEIIGITQDNILVMDDYGHHPTAIRKTLEGLREFHKGRRIIVDFMSHTYSRTSGLLKEFSESFQAADMVILNKIYPSAREKNQPDELDGEFYRLTRKAHPDVHYFREPDDALPFLLRELHPGDLFITMGAGNNWTVGERFLIEKSN